MSAVQDDELQLTKKRLQNLRRKNFGLQQLAVREISKQLTFYRTHPDELEKLKSLPNVLREKILQVLMKKRCLEQQGPKEEFENLNAIFPLLLSPRIRYIELNGILSFCPDRYKDIKKEKGTQWCVELLKQIEARAPQVETLIMQRNHSFYLCYFTHKQYNNFYQEMEQSLMKLQKLNRLKVDLYAIQLNDLLKICKNLPRLQYINVGCFYSKGENLPAAPEEVLSSFRNLKELIFECPEENNNWLGCLCTRNLPNIEVVQYDPNQRINWTYYRSFDNRYQGLDFPGASNLRNICVDLAKYSAEEVDAMPTLFPKVTCLMVKNAGSLGKNVMPKFDNIKQLQLLDSCVSEVIEYLINYGQKLQSLCVGHDHELITIDLELICKHCPKLEKLSIRNMRLITPPSKIDFFAELNDFEWKIPSRSDIPDGTHDSESMVLSTILSAPKLEKVDLGARVFKMNNDLWKLNSLIQEEQILKNLHTLHVDFMCLIPEALINAMQSACAFLPKLTDFKFVYEVPLRLDPLMTSEPSPQRNIGVFKMMDVFENEK